MDNFYHDCPAMMNDGGRQLGDYKSATRRNEYIKYINDITRDDEYRLFLQQNGAKLENNIWKYHMTHNACRVNPCANNFPTRITSEQMIQQRIANDKNALSGYKTNAQNMGCEKFEDFRMTPQ